MINKELNNINHDDLKELRRLVQYQDVINDLTDEETQKNLKEELSILITDLEIHQIQAFTSAMQSMRKYTPAYLLTSTDEVEMYFSFDLLMWLQEEEEHREEEVQALNAKYGDPKCK